MKRALALLLILAPFAGGCGDSDDAVTPEPDPFALTITANVGALAVVPDSVNCEYRLIAEATGGSPEAYAQWVSGEIEWVDPSSGARFPDSLSAGDLLDYFGADRVMSGERLEASRFGWWDRPFEIHYTFRYAHPNGSTRSDDVWVDCTSP